MFPDRSTLLGALASAVVLAVAIGWLHPEVSFQDRVYASSDAQAAAAFQTVGDEILAAGEFPHWNPYVFVGMPSYASLAYNPRTYPLSEPIRAVREALGLAPMTWMLVHVWIAGLGVVCWSRWRGRSWTAATMAGVLMIAIPHLVSWGAYGHGTKLGTFAWMPWALWSAEALLRRGGIGWAAVLAASLALMLLRAHVQVAYYAVLSIGVIVLFHLLPAWRDVERRRPMLLRTGGIVVAGVVALGAALVLVLPVLEYQGHSIRGAESQGGGAAFDYATSWSLGWSELPTLWWPTTAGYGRGPYVGSMPFTDFPNYVGLPVLALALIGIGARRDRTTWALLFLAVFCTFVALGKHFFVYQLLYDLLPGFKKFRVPVMILIVQQLALVVLAAQGLDALLQRRDDDAPRPAWRGRAALVGALTVGVMLLMLGTLGAEALRSSMSGRWIAMASAIGRPTPPSDALRAAADLATADAVRIGAVVMAMVLVVLAAQKHRIPAVGAGALITLLLFVDLWRVNDPLLHPERHLPQLGIEGTRRVAVPSPTILQDASALREFSADPELTRFLLEQEPRPRVYPLGSLAADNRLASQHVVSLGGYHAAKLAVYEDLRERLFDPQRPEFALANLLAARWVVTDRPLSEQTLEAIRQLGSDLGPGPVQVTAGGSVYENRSALPRAWVVEGFEVESPGEDTTAREPEPAVLSRVLAPGFDPRRTAILSAPPQPLPEPGAASASVEAVEEGYNRTVVRVRMPAAGVLVVTDVWYPSWRVEVDGQPATLLRADHALRAVALPAGEHVVEFEYRADAYRVGRAVSTASSLLIALALSWPLVDRWRRRRGHGPDRRSEDPVA